MTTGRKALDLLRMVCDQLGYDQIETVENEETLPKDDRKLVRALNRTLRVLSGVQDWRFLRVDGEIITIAQYTTGVLRLTNGSTAVTGMDDPDMSGTDIPVWTAAMIGRALVVHGDPLIYRVEDVTSPTTLVLNREWQGDSTDGVTTADRGYRILQDRYDLPTDMDRPVDEEWHLYKDTNVTPIRVTDASTIRRRRAERMPAAVVTDPDLVAIWDQDEQNEHRVAILDPFPFEQRVVTFQYQRIHPTIDRDSQRVMFPPRYEEVIAAGIEFLIRSGPDDDNRSDFELAEYLRNRSEISSAREVGQQRMVLTPSQERVIQQRVKWRRRGQRIDWGSWFDRKDFYNL